MYMNLHHTRLSAHIDLQFAERGGNANSHFTLHCIRFYRVGGATLISAPAITTAADLICETRDGRSSRIAHLYQLSI